MASSRDSEGPIGDLLARLSGAGEEAFNQLASQLLQNPLFTAALERGMVAKGSVDRTIRDAMDFASLPSKNDIAQLLERLDSISTRLARQEKRVEDALAILAEVRTRLDSGGSQS